MQSFLQNPATGNAFFSLQHLKDMMLSNPDSSMVRYRTRLEEAMRPRNFSEAEIDKQFIDLTKNLEYASSVYAQVDDNNNFSVTRCVLLFGDTVEGQPEWDATIALCLSVDTGSTPLFLVTKVSVRTLQVEAPPGRNQPVILAEAKNADRITKIIGRSADGKPWMQRVQ